MHKPLFARDAFSFGAWVIGLLWLLSHAGLAAAEESEVRQAIKSEVAQLLDAQDFPALDALAKRYLAGERTPNGDPKLIFFDGGIDDALTHEADDVEYWAETEAQLKRWIESAPESSAARMAYARSLLARAWLYRGRDYASKVPPEAFEHFRDLVAEARQYLEANRHVAATNPLWYQMMFEVAKVQSWPRSQHEKLVDQGLDRFPDYDQLYFDAVDYYMPEWGGSMAATEVFAQKAYARTRAKQGAVMYAKVYQNVYQRPSGKKMFEVGHLNWPLLRQGAEEAIRDHPDQWNINYFARFACLAKDPDAIDWFEVRIRVLYIPLVWKDHKEYFLCLKWSKQVFTWKKFWRDNSQWFVVAGIGIVLIGLLILRRRRSPPAVDV